MSSGSVSGKACRLARYQGRRVVWLGIRVGVSSGSVSG